MRDRLILIALAVALLAVSHVVMRVMFRWYFGLFAEEARRIAFRKSP